MALTELLDHLKTLAPARLIIKVLEVLGFYQQAPAIEESISSPRDFVRTSSPSLSNMSAPPNTAPRELVEAIRNKKALFIVGAGVSIAATKGAACASWIGLLENGLQTLKKPPFNKTRQEIEVWQNLLATGSTHALISAAQFVTDTLNVGGTGRFRSWLKDTVGSLQIKDSSLLDAITSTGCPIATTNYDNLLCKASGQERITWKEPSKIHEIIKGDRKGIIHLHGHYDDADSVILSFTDYAQLTKVATQFQEIQRALVHGHTLVLVGCGAGTEDPNIGGLLKWLADIYGDSIYQHYRLERQPDAAMRQKEHGVNINVLSYGEQYSDLSSYIRALAGTDKPKGINRTSAPPKPQPPQGPAEKQILDQLEQKLITAQRREYEPLPVPGSKSALDLEQCYIQLSLWRGQANCDLKAHVELRNIWEKGGWEAQEALEGAQRIHPYEARQQSPTMVVLGDPGCGKTTLLLHFLHSDGALKEQGNKYLPIYVRLRDVKGSDLKKHIEKILGQLCDEEEEKSHIQAAINRAKSQGRLLLLLDGMDEVSKEYREGLRRRIDTLSEGLQKAHEGNRSLVTCRILPYIDPFRLKCESTTYQVAPFTNQDIEGFIQNHFRGDNASLGQQLWERLEQQHARVSSLARTPLLLAMLCLYFEENQDLPERRVLLYEKIVRQLLLDKRSDRPTEAIADDKVPILQELAYRSFQAGLQPSRPDDLMRLIAKRKLINQTGEVVAANVILKEIIERSGLLVPIDDDQLVFMHLTFQEYFVALYLKNEGRWKEAAKQHGSDGRWAEVWRLLSTLQDDAGPLIEALATQGASTELFSDITREARAIDLQNIANLIPEYAANVHRNEPPVTAPASVLLSLFQQPDLPINTAFDRLEQRYTWVALRDMYGRLFAEDGKLHQSQGKRLDPALMYIAHVHLTHALEQQREGASDITRWLKAWRGPELPNEGFKNIGKATFTMGEGGDHHEVNLSPYAMAIHPVTNSELEEYDPSHLKARTFTNEVKSQELARHPVVKISWYEAYLYAAWRGCTLPTEAQWEYAARGPEGLTYPWGDGEPTQELAIYDQEFETGHTTPVGSYPKGVSWCGLHDVAGNVLEWCTDWREPYPQHTNVSQDPSGPSNGSDRVVRGGSWDVGGWGLRGAYRDDWQPGDRGVGGGFRLASRAR